MLRLSAILCRMVVLHQEHLAKPDRHHRKTFFVATTWVFLASSCPTTCDAQDRLHNSHLATDVRVRRLLLLGQVHQAQSWPVPQGPSSCCSSPCGARSLSPEDGPTQSSCLLLHLWVPRAQKHLLRVFTCGGLSCICLSYGRPTLQSIYS